LFLSRDIDTRFFFIWFFPQNTSCKPWYTP
jgi:hypothetical protein